MGKGRAEEVERLRRRFAREAEERAQANALADASSERLKAANFERGVRRAMKGLDLVTMPRGPLREERREELDFERLTFPPDEAEETLFGKYDLDDAVADLQIVPYESEDERIARHNARDRSGPGTLTVREWRALVDAFERRCAYCGVRPRGLTVDHVRPVFLRGRTAADNVLPACFRCNRDKGIKSLEEWQSSHAWWLAFIGRCALAAERIIESK
jgi:hypothetical protein